MTTDTSRIALLLSVSGGGDAFGPFFAALALDKPLVEQMLRRAGAFRVARNIEPELYNMSYFSYEPEFCESGRSTDPNDFAVPEDAKKVKALFGSDDDDDDDLLCEECGDPMIVLDEETTHHLLAGSSGIDDYDYNKDADHVARAPDEDELYPKDGWRHAKPGEAPAQGNVRLDYCKLVIASSLSHDRPDMVDFHWVAGIKHTDCEIETCELKEEDIRELLGVLV